MRSHQGGGRTGGRRFGAAAANDSDGFPSEARDRYRQPLSRSRTPDRTELLHRARRVFLL